MKVKLLRDARIRHYAGETVDVSAEEYQFLVSTGSARPECEDEPKQIKPAKKTEKKK